MLCITHFLVAVVNGEWSNWGAWSSCSISCGPGTKEQTRVCDNPAPENGGTPCAGSSSESENCNEQACSVDGAWADWGVWSDCTLTCGDGTKDRSRTCTNPAPSNGGYACVGDGQESSTCNEAPCPGRVCDSHLELIK